MVKGKKIQLGVLLALSMAIAIPAQASSYSRRVRAVHNAINDGVSSLRQQMASQQGRAGVYAEVGRSNDIFLFCKQGVPTHSWIGVNPATGSYQITNYWSVNTQWIPYYIVICPYGGQNPGNWNAAGDGSQVPFKH